jgi:hypothetical protein
MVGLSLPAYAGGRSLWFSAEARPEASRIPWAGWTLDREFRRHVRPRAARRCCEGNAPRPGCYLPPSCRTQ